jgi:hypothetical protein
MKFLEAVANVFRVPDLRKRLLFALGLLAVYRLGAFIPTPGVDTNKLNQYFQQNAGSLFGFIDLFKAGELAAKGAVVVACADRETLRSVPMPDELRAKLSSVLIQPRESTHRPVGGRCARSTNDSATKEADHGNG